MTNSRGHRAIHYGLGQAVWPTNPYLTEEQKIEAVKLMQ